MTEAELLPGAADFAAFHARFAPFFCRREPREAARLYLRGLLSPTQRKNAWQLAEAMKARRISTGGS